MTNLRPRWQWQWINDDDGSDGNIQSCQKSSSCRKVVYSCVLQPWLGAATKLPRRNCHCYDPMKRTSKVAANAFCDNRGDNDNGEEHVAERAACLGSFVSVATNFISCKPVTPLMSATPASFTNRLLCRHQVDCVVPSRGPRQQPRACGPPCF